MGRVRWNILYVYLSLSALRPCRGCKGAPSSPSASRFSLSWLLVPVILLSLVYHANSSLRGGYDANITRYRYHKLAEGLRLARGGNPRPRFYQVSANAGDDTRTLVAYAFDR